MHQQLVNLPFGNAPPGHANNEGTSRSVDEDFAAKPRIQGEAGNVSQDMLFEQFKEGLDSCGLFADIPIGSPQYIEQLNNARCIFQETLQGMDKIGIVVGGDHKVLIEAFKVQGNATMANKRYFQAVELYTLAISLFGDNVVYYYNRAAAHTQIGKYMEAIEDCNKSIQIDPCYNKAYSHLGLAFVTINFNFTKSFIG